MRKLLLVLLIIIISLTTISCKNTEDVTEPPVTTIEEPTVEEKPDLPVVSDKNLMTSTAEEYGITHDNYPKIDGSTSTLDLSRQINMTMYKSEENGNFPSQASKTVPSYKLLIDGDVDLIIVPYASQDVLNLAKVGGVELEFIPVVAEALIFITPIENETKNITMEQVRKFR